MAKSKKTTNEQIAEHFRSLAALYEDATEPVEVDEDVEEVEDDEEVEVSREDVEEATESGIKALRELAASVGIESTKKAEILAEFDELLGDEDEDEEDEDDEDEEDEEGEEYSREDLEDLDLKALRKLARDEFEIAAADYKGLDQDALIDLMLDEDDEDEEEDEDDEDEEDDEEVEEIDEDALKAMTQKDLIGLAKELEIKVPAALKKQSAANKKKLVKMILDSGEDEE